MTLPTIFALVALGLGYALQSRGSFPARIKAWIALGLLNVFYPSLIFAALLLKLNAAALASLWILPFLVSLMLLLGLGLGIRLEDHVGLQDDSQKRSFRFLALLPNYSYLPLVVAQALWGDDGITLVAIAAVGADLILWTLGVPQIMKKRHMDLRRLVFNPPLLSLFAALILLQEPFSPWRHTMEPGLRLLRQIGSVTSPASMLLLGAHLARRTKGRQARQAHAALLGLRLLLIPGLMTLLFGFWPDLLPSLPKQVLMLIASMPGAIVSVVLSEVHEASPDFAARNVLLGHVLWVLTGPLWLWINRYGAVCGGTPEKRGPAAEPPVAGAPSPGHKYSRACQPPIR